MAGLIDRDSTFFRIRRIINNPNRIANHMFIFVRDRSVETNAIDFILNIGKKDTISTI